MEISKIANPFPEAGQTTSAAVTQDFETFLKMLTTQIQNQDPLAPVSADDFANQLASFSMVEQQTLTNQRLSDLISGMETSQRLSRIEMLGQTVSHAGPFQFFGTPVDLKWQSHDTIEPMKLLILDDQGLLVSEIPVSQGDTGISWDGTDIEGRVVNPGAFSAELVTASEGLSVGVVVTTSAEVEEIDLSSGAEVLILSDGTRVTLSDVSSVRR